MSKQELPLDVVPGTYPPRFAWKQRVDTPSGTTLIQNEGTLPASVEEAAFELVTLAKALAVKCDKLQAFKDWVHNYLDAQDVPKEFPDGTHTKCGCRIGDRMDWLVAQLREAQARCEGLSERVAKQSDQLSRNAERAQGSTTKKVRG